MGEAKLYGKSGGGMKIDGIIADYYAYAGENISAGDFVEFINGVASMTAQQNSYAVAGASTAYTTVSACLLDSTRVFVAYGVKTTVGNKGACYIVRVKTDKSITQYTTYKFSKAGAGSYISVAKITTDKVAISYVNGDTVYAVLATVSDTVITYENTSSVYSSSGYEINDTSISQLSSTKMLLCFSRLRGSASYAGIHGCTLTVSGTEITANTIYELIMHTNNHISIDSSSSSTSAHLVYSHSGDSEYGGYVPLTISSNKVTAGSIVKFAQVATSSTTVLSKSASASTAIVAYRNNIGAGYVQYYDGSSFGSALYLGNLLECQISISYVIGEFYAISYVYSDGSCKTAILTASGSTLSLDTPITTSSTGCLSLSTVAPLNDVIVLTSVSSAGVVGAEQFFRDGTKLLDTIDVPQYETQVRKATSRVINGVAKTSGTGGTNTAHNEIISVYVPNI